jgi:hypothetical protein
MKDTAPFNPSVPARKLSVLLVDDHAVVREGHQRLLEHAPDLMVVGEAALIPGT